MTLLVYPFLVLSFWYKDALKGLWHFFAQINRYVMHLFSLPLLFSTFFKPLKNEYRKNLVLFSILAGMAVKTFLIMFSLSIFLLVLLVEVIFFTAFIVFPVLPIYLLIR